MKKAKPVVAPLTCRAEILRVLFQGDMTVSDMELALPMFSRGQLLSGVSGLRAKNLIHIIGQRRTRHPRYKLGADPLDGLYRTPEDRDDRDYRQRTNQHLRPDWRPQADPVAVAWMHNPITIDEESHV